MSEHSFHPCEGCNGQAYGLYYYCDSCHEHSEEHSYSAEFSFREIASSIEIPAKSPSHGERSTVSGTTELTFDPANSFIIGNWPTYMTFSDPQSASGFSLKAVAGSIETPPRNPCWACYTAEHGLTHTCASQSTNK